MYGIFGALCLLIGGIADKIGTSRKGRESAAKLQRHFDELERVRREGDARIQKSIDRMMREDEERKRRQEEN